MQAANAFADGRNEAEAEARRHALRILSGANFYGEETTVDTTELLNFCRRYLEKPSAKPPQPACNSLAKALRPR
jgi:hypothetical protein